MRDLMGALRRKLGLVRTSEAVTILPIMVIGDSFTIGNPSLICTEMGVEGPLWPWMGDHLTNVSGTLGSSAMWEAEEVPRQAVDAPSTVAWYYSI